MKKILSFLLILAVIGGLYFLLEEGKCGGIGRGGGCTTDTIGGTSGGTGNSNYKTELVNVKGVRFKMVKVDGGSFTNAEGIQVKVSTFCIGATEVTQELWEAVMGANPSYFKGNPQRPVENFSWSYMRSFITKLNELTGKKFRLPTEAEWEFAARGGNKSRGYKYSGSNNSREVAWWISNGLVGGAGVTHPVAALGLNELGLSDMSGNVAELCADRHSGHGGCIRTKNENELTPSSRSSETCPDIFVGIRLAL